MYIKGNTAYADGSRDLRAYEQQLKANAGMADDGTPGFFTSEMDRLGVTELVFTGDNAGGIDDWLINEAWRWEKLERVMLAKENRLFQSIDGVVYAKYGQDLIFVPRGVKELIIPEGTDRAYGGAARMLELKTLSIPNSMATVGGEFTDIKADILEIGGLAAETFCSQNCTFRKVTVRAGTKRVTASAFDCCGVEEAVFNDGLESIGIHAFCGCHLSSVEIPGSVMMVGPRALGESVTDIRMARPAKGVLEAIANTTPKDVAAARKEFGHPIAVHVGDMAFALPSLIATGKEYMGFRKRWGEGIVDEAAAHRLFQHASNACLKHDTALLELTLNPQNEDAAAYVRKAAPHMAMQYARQGDAGKMRSLLRHATLSQKAILKAMAASGETGNTENAALLLDASEKAKKTAGLKL